MLTLLDLLVIPSLKHRYQEALLDFEAASDSFIQLKDIARFSDARANYALTLYELGRIDESTKVMKDIIRKNPGYADMRVALAADYWSKGDYINALKVCKLSNYNYNFSFLLKIVPSFSNGNSLVMKSKLDARHTRILSG